MTGDIYTAVQPEQYPGVEPAQAFVLPSYQWMVTRVEAADSRIQAVVTFVATLTLAVPALGKAVRPWISFDSHWFVGAMLVALGTAVIGVTARTRGALVLPNPRVLYEQWLHLSPWEFQKDAIFFAGKHFDANARLVRAKALAVAVMAGLVVLELLLLVAWLAGGLIED